MLNNYFCARNTKSDQRITLRRQERKKIIKYITSLHSKGCNRNRHLSYYITDSPYLRFTNPAIKFHTFP